METRFFDTGFRFDKYINDRLLEISDEDERRVLKDVVKGTLIPFYEQTQEAYTALEARLEQTKTEKMSRYEILTGLADKRRVDITEEAMVPMQYTDLQDFLVDVEEMAESLERQEQYKVMRFFLRADMNTVQKLQREKRYYRGTIYTNAMEYPGVFQVVENNTYLKQVADLYPVFEKNGLEWNTVCAPYLFKFFDVEIVRTECPMDAEIDRIVVDFEEYQQYVDFQAIPMWNVRFIDERSSVYPDFAIDRVHYEHCIYKERFLDNRDYLVDSKDANIWETFQQNGDLHVICDADKPVRWTLIELGYDALTQEQDEMLFGNYHRKKSGRCIHTCSEVKRFVEELGYEKYIHLTDVKVAAGYKRGTSSSYSMNWFLEDEIRTSLDRSVLLFTFQAEDKAFYLNADIMSYLISAIQWELPEFECIGELS